MWRRWWSKKRNNCLLPVTVVQNGSLGKECLETQNLGKREFEWTTRRKLGARSLRRDVRDWYTGRWGTLKQSIARLRSPTTPQIETRPWCLPEACDYVWTSKPNPNKKPRECAELWQRNGLLRRSLCNVNQLPFFVRDCLEKAAVGYQQLSRHYNQSIGGKAVVYQYNSGFHIRWESSRCYRKCNRKCYWKWCWLKSHRVLGRNQ